MPTLQGGAGLLYPSAGALQGQGCSSPDLRGAGAAAVTVDAGGAGTDADGADVDGGGVAQPSAVTREVVATSARTWGAFMMALRTAEVRQNTPAGVTAAKDRGGLMGPPYQIWAPA